MHPGLIFRLWDNAHKHSSSTERSFASLFCSQGVFATFSCDTTQSKAPELKPLITLSLQHNKVFVASLTGFLQGKGKNNLNCDRASPTNNRRTVFARLIGLRQIQTYQKSHAQVSGIKLLLACSYLPPSLLYPSVFGKKIGTKKMRLFVTTSWTAF